MLATSLTAAVVGVEARLVRVEADTSAGFPKFTMLGLADSCVRESEGRIRAALRNCGYEFKWDRRITVNLAPAHLRKVGSSYDLATALGLLAADGAIPAGPLRDVLLVGELALDGGVRPVSGVLPMTIAARRAGLRAAVVPLENAAEAAAVGLDAHPVRTLIEAVELASKEPMPPPPRFPATLAAPEPKPDLRDVRGQLAARRALEVAAAGGHNLLLTGPPGSGKTMLARRLPGLLPPMDEAEALVTSAIHSAAGIPLTGLVRERPFRSPHHTASAAALVGGGAQPRPGEVSLAHNGVLFLDELPEFPRRALEALRQPLEEGFVTIARARGSLRMPAAFQLVAAMNPCVCAHLGDPRLACRCTPRQVQAYRARLSGPLLDRVDLKVEVQPLCFDELTAAGGESTADVACRVLEARRTQRLRNEGSGANARLVGDALRRVAWPDQRGQALLRSAVDRMGLSARACDRVLRVARTISDLGGASSVTAASVAEALHYRDAD